VPEEAKAFAIVVDDPDARGGTYIHWVLANLDGTTADLVENSLPERAIQGRNSAGQASYAPPCPPKGERHRYRYTVYALKEPLPADQVTELDKSLPAIAERTVARGRLTGYLGQNTGS
jgi:Raf kinase inhibitor-like YbhB/YbcL family protein